MKDLYEFLNAQNGYRLFIYCLVFVVVIAIIGYTLRSVFESIASIFKNRHKIVYRKEEKVNKDKK